MSLFDFDFTMQATESSRLGVARQATVRPLSRSRRRPSTFARCFLSACMRSIPLRESRFSPERELAESLLSSTAIVVGSLGRRPSVINRAIRLQDFVHARQVRVRAPRRRLRPRQMGDSYIDARHDWIRSSIFTDCDCEAAPVCANSILWMTVEMWTARGGSEPEP